MGHPVLRGWCPPRGGLQIIFADLCTTKPDTFYLYIIASLWTCKYIVAVVYEKINKQSRMLEKDNSGERSVCGFPDITFTKLERAQDVLDRNKCVSKALLYLKI